MNPPSSAEPVNRNRYSPGSAKTVQSKPKFVETQRGPLSRTNIAIRARLFEQRISTRLVCVIREAVPPSERDIIYIGPTYPDTPSFDLYPFSPAAIISRNFGLLFVAEKSFSL